MSAAFTSVGNHNEPAVYGAVSRQAAHRPGLRPGLRHNPGLLADAACVALNRLAPRCIRHEMDFVSYARARTARRARG